MSGTNYDNTFTFGYNPSSQLTSRTRSNSAFDWILPAGYNHSYGANGLDQYTSVAGLLPTYDSRGNVTSDGVQTYGYDYDNRLTSVSGGVSLQYDPAARLHQVVGTETTRFLYDGADIIAEYNASGAMLRRYVHGPGVDEPLVWYEGPADTDRRYLIADERGSVIAVTNNAGTVTQVNTYDAYGVPGSANAGRFQYTGQAYLMYYSTGIRWNEAEAHLTQMRDYHCLDFPESPAVPGGGPFFGDHAGAPAEIPQMAPQPQFNICEGNALIYAGNPQLIGRRGGMQRPVRADSAAIVPRQWTGFRVAGPLLRSQGALVSGVTASGQHFLGLDDTVGNTGLGADPQAVIMARANGALFIELISGFHEGMTTVTLDIPINRNGSSLQCPTGTIQTGTR